MIDELIGKTIQKINENSEELRFFTVCGKEYRMYHRDDCCESVTIDDICGNLDDLLNSPIIKAEEVESGADLSSENDKDLESVTWTFYHLSTVKGSVTIRWFGTSNGYYSESADFEEVTDKNRR